ncbi:MAG: hypothetical protein J0L54_12130 [Chitinophagales bacterium]|nr:hypothetical protein [Chitinophagales bacterium]
MKKFLLAILAVVYISSSVGATIHMHYCMGKLADWGIGQIKSNTCGKCGMEKSVGKEDGCCRDEQKFIKDNTDQKTAGSVFNSLQLITAVIPVSFIEIASIGFSFAPEENPISHAPPRSNGVAVYVRNCVFRI